MHQHPAIAMRVVDGGSNPTYWLLNDQLGSTAITADASGVKTAELRFKAWGESRYTYGSTPTTYRYTGSPLGLGEVSGVGVPGWVPRGQREQSQLSIYFYGARWYDPQLSRFLQPDSIIPLESQGVQAWDRYGYANNNPVRYVDPNGHDAIPYSELLKQAIQFFEDLGYEIVGDPATKKVFIQMGRI